jgi:hypothetical protein
VALERTYPAIPQIIGGGRILPSPNQFYLTGEDRLRIVSANSLTGVALKAQCRTANIQGDTIAHSFDHVPNTDRSTRATEHALGTGSVLNVTIFASAGAPQMGHTFVMAQLIRGSGAAAVILGTLLAGYVTTTQALGFPGSPIVPSLQGEPLIRFIAGTVPGAGLNITETVPTGARWELLSLRFNFQSSALAALRRVVVVGIGAGLTAFTAVAFTTQIASELWAHTFAAGLNGRADGGFGAIQSELPARVILPPAGGFQTSVFNMQVGDQFSAIVYVVREWLEVP